MRKLLLKLEDFRLLPTFVGVSMAIGSILSISDFELTPPMDALKAMAGGTFDARENNVSNHLTKPREAGLVRTSRHKVDARWVYYERDEDALVAASEVLAEVL